MKKKLFNKEQFEKDARAIAETFMPKCYGCNKPIYAHVEFKEQGEKRVYGYVCEFAHCPRYGLVTTITS